MMHARKKCRIIAWLRSGAGAHTHLTEFLETVLITNHYFSLAFRIPFGLCCHKASVKYNG